MSGRSRWRRLALGLPVITVIVVGGLLGGLIIAEQSHKVDAAEAADEAARSYDDQVQQFRANLAEVIEAHRGGPAAPFKEQLEAHLVDPPQLPSVGSAGARTSAAYRDAQYTHATLLDPYAELVDVLGRAEVAEPFIAGADRVLALRVEDIVGTTTITSIEPVEQRVIPAFTQGRDEFDQVPVPPGQEALAEQVGSAVQDVIDQCRLMVSLARLGQNHSFNYGPGLTAASEAVRAYRMALEAEIATAIDATVP